METVAARLHTTVSSGSQESAPRTPTPTAPASAPCAAGPSRTTARHRPTPEFSPAPGLGAAPGRAPAVGEPLDLVTVPARQGLEAVDILRRAAATSVWSGADGPDGTDTAEVGPVLHDGPGDTVGFLVPPGTADGWDLPGSACTQTHGRGTSFTAAIPGPAPASDAAPAVTPPPGGGTGEEEGSCSAALSFQEAAPRHVPEPPVTGTGWLLPPADTGHVTDPAALRRALGEAARLIEAADRCR